MAKKRKGELPSGNVRVRVYEGRDASGKAKYRSFTAPTRSMALAMANEWKVCRSMAVQNITILDTVKEYIAVNETRWSVTTFRTYTGYIRYFAEQPIGAVRLPELTNMHVQQFVNTLSLSLSAKTVKNIYQILKPAVELKRDNFRFRCVLPQAERNEKHLPTLDDVRATLAACNIPEMRIAILFGIYGMMRRGEACAVTFDDVDYDRKTISINKSYALTVDNYYVLKSPKTKASIRTVAVSDSLLNEIRNLKRKKGNVLGFNPTSLTRRLEDTVRRAHVDPYTYHSLRHLGESIASSMKIPGAYIEAIGGWEHGSAVRTRVYDHALDSEQERYSNEYIEKIDDMFF